MQTDYEKGSKSADTHSDNQRISDGKNNALSEDKQGSGGTRKVNGSKVVYTMDKDGTRYTVLTEIKGNKEVFADFYTNKKGTKQESFIGQAENTQSARTSNSVPND